MDGRATDVPVLGPMQWKMHFYFIIYFIIFYFILLLFFFNLTDLQITEFFMDWRSDHY